MFLHALLHGATVAAPHGMLRRECRVLALVGVTVAAGIFPNGRVMHIEMSAPCGTVRQGVIRKKPSSFHCCSWGPPHGTVNGGVRPVWHGETGLQFEETEVVSLLQLGSPQWYSDAVPCGTVRQGFSPKKLSSSHCCSWDFPTGTVMHKEMSAPCGTVRWAFCLKKSVLFCFSF